MNEPSMPVSPADDSEDLSHNSTASTGSPFVSVLGFNGERRSDLLGGYHLGNGYRLYNPELRRFNSPDNMSPFGKGGINPYAYCEGDPINNIDPTGHFGVLGFLFFALMIGADIATDGAAAPVEAAAAEAVELREADVGAHEGERAIHQVAREGRNIHEGEDGAALNVHAGGGRRPLNPSMGFLHLSGASISHNDRGMLARVDDNIRASYLSRRLPRQYGNGLVDAMMVRAEGGPTVFDALMSSDGFRKVGHVGGVGGHDIYQTIGYGPSIHTEEELQSSIGGRINPLNSLSNKLTSLNEYIDFMNNPDAFPRHQNVLRGFIGGRSLEELTIERNEVQATHHELSRLQAREFYEAGLLRPEDLEEWFPL